MNSVREDWQLKWAGWPSSSRCPATHDSLHQRHVIVTTNYDKILDRHFKGGFRILSYESAEVASIVRQEHPVILKLHGSADHSSRTY